MQFRVRNPTKYSKASDSYERQPINAIYHSIKIKTLTSKSDDF